jgi:hypothetical protein
MSYETYLAYQQADAAFRALYFGRALDLATIRNRPSAKVVQQHWSTVEHVAELLLREKSLTREQILTLLLQASLDAAPVAPQPE